LPLPLSASPPCSTLATEGAEESSEKERREREERVRGGKELGGGRGGVSCDSDSQDSVCSIVMEERRERGLVGERDSFAERE
jgi:hypothetical protein